MGGLTVLGCEGELVLDGGELAEGIEPDVARVKLLRHTLTAKERGRQQILDIWRADRSAFEGYQCRRRDDFFPRTDHVAGFVTRARAR